MPGISLSDVRWRARNDGDVQDDGGAATSIVTSNQGIVVKDVKWRAQQQVVFVDAIENAITIDWEGQPAVSISGSTFNCTDGWEGYGGPTAWAKFKPPVTGPYSYTLEVIEGNPGMAVEIAKSLVSGVPQGYGDLTFLSYVESGMVLGDAVDQLDANETYYLLASSWPDQTTPGTFSFYATVYAPTGTATNNQNTFPGNYLASVPNYYVSGDNVKCTSQSGEPIHAGVGSGKSAWYSWTSYHTGSVTFEVERAWGFDPVLAVYTGSVVNSLTLVASNDDQSAGNPLPKVTFSATKDTTYRIAIDSKGGGVGGFVLKWSMPSPSGNNFDDPIVLASSNSISRTGDTSHGADPDIPTLSWAEKDYYAFPDTYLSTIWYKWVAPSNGWTTVTLSSVTESDGRVGVYDGTLKENLTFLYDSGWGSFTTNFPAKSGKTYYFRVDTDGRGQTWNFTLSNNTANIPINWTPSGLGDWTSNNGVTYSGGEFISGAEGNYIRKEIYPSTNPYKSKNTYISFRIRYGSSAKIEQLDSGADNHSPLIGRILDTAGVVRLNIYLSQTQQAGGATSNNDVVVGGRNTRTPCSTEWIRIEIFHNSGNCDAAVYANGRYAGITSWSFTGSSNALGSLDLGYISDPSPGRTLDIRYSDIVIRDVWNRDFDYRPIEPANSANPHGVLWFNGWEHGLGDFSRYANDTGNDTTPFWRDYGTIVDTARGKAIRINNSSTAKYVLPIYDDSTRGKAATVTAVSFWAYVESYPSASNYNILFHMNYLASPLLQSTGPTLCMEDDGNLFIYDGWNRRYLKRKLDTSRWHLLEFVADMRHPKNIFEVYINGELLWSGATDIVETRINNWGHPTLFSHNSASILFTDLVYGRAYNGRLGAFKTALIKPNSTTEVNTGPKYPELPNSWIKSSDDGVTYSEITAGDAVHTYVNTWPPVRSTSSSHNATTLISQCNGYRKTGAWNPGNFYVEFGLESMPSGQTPVALKIMEIARSHRIVGGFDPSVYIDDNYVWTSTSILISYGSQLKGTNYHAGYCFGFTPMQSLAYESIIPYNVAATDWTENAVNTLRLRWGHRGGEHVLDNDWGNVLNAVGIEVLMRDTEPALAPYANLYEPWFEVSGFGLWGEISTLSGCDVYDRRPGYSNNNRADTRVLDPYLVGKVWWFFAIWNGANNRNANNGNADIETYWRVVPAYDSRYPGFDGSFHDTNLDRANGTTSFDLLSKFFEPSFYDWSASVDPGYRIAPNYPPHREIKKSLPFNDAYIWNDRNLDFTSLLYNPCWDEETGKIASDRTVRIQAYVRDKWGNTSSTAEYVINMPKGNCCGAISTPIKYRAYQTPGQVTIDLNDGFAPGSGSSIAGGGTEWSNATQSGYISGSPTGGTFTLTYNGQTTAPLAYNASTSAIQTALENLSNINPGDITVTGGPLPGSAFLVTFLTGSQEPTMTINVTNLTGGVNVTGTVTTIVEGGISQGNAGGGYSSGLNSSVFLSAAIASIGSVIVRAGSPKAPAALATALAITPNVKAGGALPLASTATASIVTPSVLITINTFMAGAIAYNSPPTPSTVITSVAANATASVIAPTVSVGDKTIIGVPTVATASVTTPVIEIRVTAIATATANVVAPVVTSGVFIVAPVATTTASVVAPTVLITVTAVAISTASVVSQIPAITVTAIAEATANVVAPTLFVGVIILTPPAIANANQITLNATVTVGIAEGVEATASVDAPVVTAGSFVIVSSPAAASTASVTTPVPLIDMTSAFAEATASVVAPFIPASRTIFATAASATANTVSLNAYMFVSPSASAATASIVEPTKDPRDVTVAVATASASGAIEISVISPATTSSAAISAPVPEILVTSIATATASVVAPVIDTGSVGGEGIFGQDYFGE